MSDILRVFSANAELAGIIAALNAKGWNRGEINTTGSLTQYRFNIPLLEYSGYMLCLQFIFGHDTDADDAESVEFCTEFGNLCCFIPADRGGNNLVKVGASGISNTGFTYQIEGDATNQNVNWFAAGYVLEAL